MTDTYLNLVNSGFTKKIAQQLGLPRPAVLRRFRPGQPLVDGPVLVLDVDGDQQVVEPQRPFGFSGDDVVVASVPEGPVQVLNVVVDPEVVHPFVTVLELGRGSALPLAADQAAYVLTGEQSGSLVLGPGEAAGRATVAVVTLERT